MSLFGKTIKSIDAHPDYYDYINSIDFRSKLITLGGGQSVNLECGVNFSVVKYEKEDSCTPKIFDYTQSVVVERGTLKLEYFKIDSYWDACPKFDRLNKCRFLNYTIYQGKYIFDGAYGMVPFYTHKIVFDGNPIPQHDICPSLFLMIEGEDVFNENIYYGGYDEIDKKYFKKLYREWDLKIRKSGKNQKYFKYILKYFPNEV